MVELKEQWRNESHELRAEIIDKANYLVGGGYIQDQKVEDLAFEMYKQRQLNG